MLKTPEGRTRKTREEARREEELDRKIEQEDARIQAQREHRERQTETEQRPDLAPEAPAAAATGDATHPAENIETRPVHDPADRGHDGVGMADAPEILELSNRPTYALDIRVPDTRSPATVRTEVPERIVVGSY